MAELEDVLAVVFVHGLAERAPKRNPVVADDRRVVAKDAASGMNQHERRHDGADSTTRELYFPVDARLRAGAIVVIEASGKIRSQDAILDRQIAEAQR